MPKTKFTFRRDKNGRYVLKHFQGHDQPMVTGVYYLDDLARGSVIFSLMCLVDKFTLTTDHHRYVCYIDKYGNKIIRF